MTCSGELLDLRVSQCGTQEQVADAVGLSASQLQRRFSKAIGRTIVQELLRKRLEEAKRLLCTTELPVADLVPRLGLRSKAYFHKVFQAHVGMTPIEYRKNC
jgi:AraC-like DNA-binding protein